jgi:hypothetical protein
MGSIWSILTKDVGYQNNVMGMDASYDNISEVIFLLQKYKQKMIAHNDDNYINKLYNMIY